MKLIAKGDDGGLPHFPAGHRGGAVPRLVPPGVGGTIGGMYAAD
jgi:hypothetical protein